MERLNNGMCAVVHDVHRNRFVEGDRRCELWKYKFLWKKKSEEWYEAAEEEGEEEGLCKWDGWDWGAVDVTKCNLT